jgi:multidrug/hemolysin transport system ATP-binding protein
MEEAANADKIAIIDNGKIIEYDTPMKLKEKYASNIVRILPKNESNLLKYLDKNKYEYTKRIDNIEVLIKSSLDALELLNKINDNLNSFEVIEGNMDQVFINLTGKDIREE